jgi:Type II secretion system (T2SS), protein G
MKPAQPAKRRLLGWLFSFPAVVVIILVISAAVRNRPVCGVSVPKTDLANLQSALEDYRSVLGGYPQGTAAQILDALRGENTDSKVFLTVSPQRLNASGEYLDPWHTPYRVAFSPTGKPHFYSFGPNRQDDQERKGSDDITLDAPALVGRAIP